MDQTNLKNYYLKKIKNSNALSDNALCRNLFELLVKAHTKNERPRGATIAREIFGKDENFNATEDSIVRVYIHKLRKKLDEYYSDEGKNDKLKFRLPKGSYKLLIENNSIKNKIVKNIKINKTLVIIYTSTLVLLALFIATMLYYNNLQRQIKVQSEIGKNDFFWQDIIQKDKTLKIVLGNMLVLSREEKMDSVSFYNPEALGPYVRHFKHIGWHLRDININSVDDFIKFQDTSQSGENWRIEKKWHFFDKLSIWSLPPILKILYQNHVSVNFAPSAAIYPKDMLKDNILYVGSYHNLNYLKQLLNKPQFKFQIQQNTLSYQLQDSDSVAVYQYKNPTGGPFSDWVLFSKLPGPSDNHISIIAGFHKTSVHYIVHYITSKNNLNKLKEQIDKKVGFIPDYFLVLFHIDAISEFKTHMDIDLIENLSS